MGILFNSVTQFVLQSERTKRRVKRDDLDTLSEVYIGPAGGEDSFIPLEGSQHSQYNLMRLISSESKQLPALVVQVTLNHQGKLANGSSYTSVPTVSKNWMEGEVTYQTNGSSGTTQPFTFAGQTKWVTFSQPGIVSWTRRYTGRCVQLSYITNQVPTGEPTNVGLAQGFLGFQNIWDVMSGFSGGMQISGGGGVITQMACTDVHVEDRADGWYKVTETYQSKMFPGPAGYQTASGGVTGTASTRLIDSSTTEQKSDGTGGSTNADNQTPDYSAYDFTKGMGSYPMAVATNAANYGDQTLAVSAPGSVGASTYASTGMDPAFGNTGGGTADAAQIYPTISSDSSTPATPDVGATSQAYSG